MSDSNGKPALYQSPPESIALARETMRDIKEALTRDADGRFPARYAEVDWDGMNMRPPEVAWQDMDMEQRYDLLLHVLNESIWNLDPPAKWDEPSDSQKLALEFVRDEQRQLHAELQHDYGLRFLEDRLVRYEDDAERTLDSAAAGRKAVPQHPWPSEIANQNRYQPDNDHGDDHDKGHDAGHSM